jgi:putative MATE family efflux protein
MLNYSYISLLRVSIPVMLGMLIQFAIFITDAAFLGRLESTIAFNAVSTSGLIILTLTSVCYGLYHGTQILVAKYLGKDDKQISGLFYNSFFILMLFGVLMFALTKIIAAYFLNYIVEDISLINAMQEFMQSRAWGFLFSVSGFTFLAFYTGVARTQFLIWNSITVAGINIVLDYSMIFGEFGFPELGMMGASYASNIAEFCGLLFGIIYITFDKQSRTIINSLPIKISLEKIKTILNTSTPLMAQGLLATFGWAVFFLLIEKIGQNELEVSQVIRNIYYIILVPIIGFSSTTKTYVSNMLSHKAEKEKLVTMLKRICLLSFSSVLIITIINFVVPETVIRLITNKQDIIENSIPILRFISIAMLQFSVTVIFLNIIAGAGKTFQTMMIELITIVIYLVASVYVTIINYQNMIWVWSMEYLYFSLIGIFSLVYIRYSKLLDRKHE